MRRTPGLALIAASASGAILDAQECPERRVQHIRPSLRQGPLELAGTCQAPFEFVCGRQLAVRVHQSGTELTAVAQAPAGCPQSGRLRWRGSPAAGQTSFDGG